MSKQKQRAPREKKHSPNGASGQGGAAHRVTNKDRSSLVHSIASAVVVKDQDLVFLSDHEGRVPLDGRHGFGLYYHDCRFLNGYELRLVDALPETLVAAAPHGFKAELVQTNPDIHLPDGRLVQKEDLAIEWERIIDASHVALRDRILLRNHSIREVSLSVALQFAAGFEDVFTVRGQSPDKTGRLHSPAWKDGVLTFAYDGADGLHRRLTIHFSPEAEVVGEATARFPVTLPSQQTHRIDVTLFLTEQSTADRRRPKAESLPDFQETSDSLEQATQKWLAEQTTVRSDTFLLEDVLERSLRDLRILRSNLQGQMYFAGGAPWYVCLFGRDSLTASLQSLAYEPQMAEHTLRLLARYQGKKVDEWRDEAPGKIMHELRVGEMARTNQVPQSPYYGTIDATPLFLILVARHAAWTGSLRVFQDLRNSIEAALTWMAEYGDPTGDGYLAYKAQSKKGLGNQGWKDSSDAIVNADGSLAKAPIALAEVQGYVYLAKVGLADLFRRDGQADRADRLRQEADALRQRFNRDFWLEDQGIYALALQDGKQPAAVVSSNAGQVLWSGVADADKARRTAERLMQDDMFSGWGIRTLSSKEKRFNPVGYHLGTVWPHDNSIIAAGFRGYGLDDDARRIFTGVFDAAQRFPTYRLPEVFSGFGRQRYGLPVHYPVACHPQAWAAGALPFMMQTLLGLTPEAFDHRLRIVRPMLPDGVSWVELHGLRVGSAKVDLRFDRAGERIEVKVLQSEGPLEVVPEQ